MTTVAQTPTMNVMISSEDIAKRVKELGHEINTHYQNSDKELVLVGLLRGSVLFMADLCRAIDKPHELDFMTASSYAKGTVSSGDVKILKDLDSSIAGKDVLIVKTSLIQGVLWQRSWKCYKPVSPIPLRFVHWSASRLAVRLSCP